MPGVKKPKPIVAEPDNPHVVQLQSKIVDFALDEGVSYLEAALELIRRENLEVEYVADMIKRCPQLLPAIKAEAAALRLLK
jgi:hypothetical protein